MVKWQFVIKLYTIFMNLLLFTCDIIDIGCITTNVTFVWRIVNVLQRLNAVTSAFHSLR